MDSPLINGRQTEFFQSTRVIRQGCPLLPFLYIIMEKSLSRKLLAEKEAGNILCIQISQGVQIINHALFADDVIYLGGALVRIRKKFKKSLSAYRRASGGKININKSEIFGWNIDQSSMNKIASALDMKGHDDWEKLKYLGLPIFLGNNKGTHWQEVMEKIQGKINFWGGRWINQAGKLILLNSVLSATPIYQFSALLAPKMVCNRITRHLRDFLWQGGKHNLGKMHLVN